MEGGREGGKKRGEERLGLGENSMTYISMDIPKHSNKVNINVSENFGLKCKQMIPFLPPPLSSLLMRHLMPQRCLDLLLLYLAQVNLFDVVMPV